VSTPSRPAPSAPRVNRPAWETAEAREKLLTRIPRGRIGEARGRGEVATWLASDESDDVTGTTIFVDGGMVALSRLPRHRAKAAHDLP